MSGPRNRLQAWLIGLALLAGLAGAACSQGTYPFDIFYEMHYQQSFKSHEPPRLSGVAGAVAWYPNPQSTSFSDGAHLFEVNCAMCHAPDAKGDASPDGAGAVLGILMTQYGYQPLVPTDLTVFPPDFIEGILTQTTRPFGPESVMPPFGKLLSPAERRVIAQYIDTLPK